MGIDICLYIEYVNPRSDSWESITKKSIDLERRYDLFYRMGCRYDQGDRSPLYLPRGIPFDCNPVVFNQVFRKIYTPEIQRQAEQAVAEQKAVYVDEARSYYTYTTTYPSWLNAFELQRVCEPYESTLLPQWRLMLHYIHCLTFYKTPDTVRALFWWE